MTPIAILELEHRVIENVLDSLEGFAASLGSPRSGPRVIMPERRMAPPGDDSSNELSTFVELLASLTDGVHHEKEEALLIPALRAAGLPDRTVAILRSELDDARRLLHELREAAVHADPWDSELVRRVRRTCHSYGTLIRARIRKEEAVLFRLAESRLSGEHMAGLTDAFARHADQQRDARERLLVMARMLSERWGGRWAFPEAVAIPA